MRLKQHGIKLLACLLAGSVMSANVVVLNSVVQVHAEANEGVGVEYHSIDEIRDYVKRNGATLNVKPEFDRTPAETAPYDPGKLSDQTQQSALDMLKQIRYIAGVSDQVELSEELCTYAQAGAYVNYINNELSHHPRKPEGMSDGLYDLGLKGASSSNMAMAGVSSSLNAIIALLWMEDGDKSNIDRIGHRRWLLNPEMGKTGFGMAGSYSSVYVFDQSNTAASETGVVWPAQNMPTEYFDSQFPWSISLGHEVHINDIQVSLTRVSDGKTWNFSSGSSDGDFYVNNVRYGMPGCIIFRPSDGEIKEYKDGDSYRVTITGDQRPISYTVNFFDLIALEGISAEYKGGPVEEGGTAKASDIAVTGTYSDGRKGNITDFTVAPYEIKAGDNEVLIQYKDKTTTVKIPGVQGAAQNVTIQFDSTGGRAVSARTVEKGSKLTEIPTTSKDGAVFEGWYTKETGGVKLEKNTIQNENKTYYAHWIQKTVPDTPDKPDMPDKPDTPDKPDMPDEPDTPDNWTAESRKMTGFHVELVGDAVAGENVRNALSVEATYSDGTSGQISDYTVVPETWREGVNIAVVVSNGFSGTIEVRVPAASYQKVGNWKLNKRKAVVKKGKTLRLSVKGLKSNQVLWSTSKNQVASVSKKGVVKGKKAGKAIITAVTEDGTVLRCKVTVRKAKKFRL